METPRFETMKAPSVSERSIQFTHALKKANEMSNEIERSQAMVEAARSLVQDGYQLDALEMAHEANQVDMLAGRRAIAEIVESRSSEIALVTLEKTLEKFTSSEMIKNAARELIAKRRQALRVQ